MNYSWAPYIWMNEAAPPEGGTQNYLVLDFTVTDSSLSFPSIPDSKACSTNVHAGPAPQAPVVTSPTQDPEAWSTNNTLTFTWAQPPGDGAAVAGYAWALDHEATTTPRNARGVITAATYNDVEDGVWYLHVRAANEEGQWGSTAHRKVRVDTHPPQVSLALDPPESHRERGLVYHAGRRRRGSERRRFRRCQHPVQPRRPIMADLRPAVASERRYAGHDDLRPRHRRYWQCVRAGFDRSQDRPHSAGFARDRRGRAGCAGRTR